jgi:putative peptidoglycan lipid II flippase
METQAKKPAGRSRLARSAAISSIAVMGSRVMGLVREQVFAFFFGASREYDAFLTAFRIPNLLRDLLAEGALSAAFVTTFTKELQGKGKARAFHLANLVLNALVILLTVVVIAGIFFAEPIVNAIAYGFDPEKTALAATLTQIMFPFILFVALAALAMGMLNAQEYFALPQSASTFFNITSVVTGLGTAFLLSPDYMLALWNQSAGATTEGAARAMIGMAIGTLTGGLVQWLIQMPTLRSTGYRWSPALDWKDPGFQTVLRLMGPAVIGAAAVQLNVFVNSNFASMLGDRPISWLNYAFRLMQFPIGVFGVAVMAAAVPALSRALSSDDYDSFGKTLTGALELVLLLTLPAAVGLAVLGEPIIRLIYEHGRFEAVDTAATAAALAAYAFGLPGYSALKIVQPAFIAKDDAKTPMYVSLSAVGANAVLNYVLIKVFQFGHVGLAASTAAMATVNVVALVIILERRRHTLERKRLAGQIGRILVASLVMGVVAHVCYVALQERGFSEGSFMAGLQIALIIPASVVVYGVAAKLLGVTTLSDAIALVRRKLKR